MNSNNRDNQLVYSYDCFEVTPRDLPSLGTSFLNFDGNHIYCYVLKTNSKNKISKYHQNLAKLILENEYHFHLSIDEDPLGVLVLQKHFIRVSTNYAQNIVTYPPSLKLSDLDFLKYVFRGFHFEVHNFK